MNAIRARIFLAIAGVCGDESTRQKYLDRAAHYMVAHRYIIFC